MNLFRRPPAAPPSGATSPAVTGGVAAAAALMPAEVQGRLAHLFRHAGAAQDALHLMDLMTRYRKQAPP